MTSSAKREETKSRNDSQTAGASARNDLILKHREVAHRIGGSLLRRWGIFIDSAEAASLIDLALCEAAATFTPSRGATLTTWFFYNLQTTLRRHCSEQLRPTAISGGAVSSSLEPGSSDERDGAALQLSSPDGTPEDAAHRGELRNLCQRALTQFSALERTVLLECCMEGEKVARVARRHGYSRGHLSLIKSNATRRFRSIVKSSFDGLQSEFYPSRAA